MAEVVIKGRWCLTEDRTRVVPEGDVLGRWLWAVDGDIRDLAEAERLGAVETGKPKARRASANKARKPAQNKGW